MPRLLSLDTSFADTTIPKLQWLDDYITRIKALTVHAWWDMALPANYTAVSGKVSQVTDLSGNGRHLVQALDANRPPINTSYFGAINGVNRGAAVFDGTTDLYMKTASTPFDGTGVWTMVEYLKLESVLSDFSTPLSCDGSGFAAYFSAAGVAQSFNGSLSVAGDRRGAKVARITRISYPGSGNAALYDEVNGTSNTASVAVGTNVPAGQAQIGAFGGGRTLKFKGGLSEVIVFKSDLTLVPANMQLVRDYLAFKYR